MFIIARPFQLAGQCSVCFMLNVCDSVLHGHGGATLNLYKYVLLESDLLIVLSLYYKTADEVIEAPWTTRRNLIFTKKC